VLAKVSGIFCKSNWNCLQKLAEMLSEVLATVAIIDWQKVKNFRISSERTTQKVSGLAISRLRKN
jgi:hypothetical protein